MKVKNLNPIERHVEKLTLAAAAAGALWLLYQGFQPTTIVPPGTSGALSAVEIEPTVETEVQKLEDAAKRIRAMKPSELVGTRIDYVDEYRQIHNIPLDPRLVAMHVPQFGPLQSPVKPGIVGPSQTQIVTVPAVPALENSTIEVARGLVQVPAAGASGAGNGVPMTPPNPMGGAASSVQDMNCVRLVADFSILKWRESMNNIGGKTDQAVPAPYQRTTFVRIEVMRERKITGGWSTWEPVTPTKAAPLDVPDPDVIKTLPDDKINTLLDALDRNWKNIIMPSFYMSAEGKSIFPPIPARVLSAADTASQASRLANLNNQNISVSPGPMGGPPMGGPPSYVNGGFGPGPGSPGVPGPGGPAATGTVEGAWTDLNEIRRQASIPVWFYDETVEPSHIYKYKCRMVLFNPVYRIDKVFKLTDQAARNEPWLSSPWVEVAALADIKPNLVFFFVPTMGRPGVKEASVKIFKWFQGGWYSYDESVYPGIQIGSERTLYGLKIDFATHFTLVDVVDQTDGDTIMVLQNPSGDLETRRVNEDSQNPMMRDLEQNLKKPVISGSTPGTGTTGGTGVTPPRTPMGPYSPGGPPSGPPYMPPGRSGPPIMPGPSR